VVELMGIVLVRNDFLHDLKWRGAVFYRRVKLLKIKRKKKKEKRKKKQKKKITILSF